jgi:lysophospholipase L1-like esterase
MLDCLIMGDSIAVGTHMASPHCAVYAKSGINSHQWVDKNRNLSPYHARTVIISLGSNDHKNVKTEEELRQIRRQTVADRVYWILPAIKPDVQAIVKRIAEDNGDTVLPIQKLQPDGVHPTWTGYKQLAQQTK